jgi:hypothetical protein
MNSDLRYFSPKFMAKGLKNPINPRFKGFKCLGRELVLPENNNYSRDFGRFWDNLFFGNALVARAPAPIWDVQCAKSGKVANLARKYPYVNHYSFHILDPDWGHITIKMSGHAPFGAQVILNGHQYVACQARKEGIQFTKEGNCFTQISDSTRLVRFG